MKRSVSGLTIVWFAVILFLTACGQAAPQPVIVETSGSSPTFPTELSGNEVATAVDFDALIAAEVAAQLAAQEGDEATLDPDQIAEIVRGQVDSYVEQTLAPTIIADTAVVAAAEFDLESSLVDLYRRANPAVVYIIVPGQGSGSGFLYDEAGHIVTNSHVVADGNAYEIVFAGGERRRAELVGNDFDSDLAVLKIDDVPAGVEPLALGDSSLLQVGNLVVTIGNPFGEQGSMSLGIVSGLGRSLPSQRGLAGGSSYSLPEVIQTDAPINPGNSGGPLLNLAGEVLGINSAIATTSGSNSGVGFAIPVNAVRRIVPALIADGSYTYPFMGVGLDDEISLDEQSAFGLSQTQGAYVLSITGGSPAAAAGLIAADPATGRGGDLIIALDSRPITSFGDLNAYLTLETSAGQTIDVTVLRDGQRLVLPLTLGARP